MGVLSFFFREEVLINIRDIIKLQYFLLFACTLKILFIKVNLGFRLIITFMKGIPFYKNEIKSKNKTKLQFLGFILYNLILILLSVLLLIRLYSV